MPCYEHFVSLQKSVFVPLVFFLHSHLGTRTGLYYIDSTALPVCDNHRINRHKVFADLAQRGKTSMGWFFGFKLHLVFNTDNEIVALKLTPGNVHDTTPVPALTRDLIGKLFGDKGYIGQKLAEDLLRRKPATKASFLPVCSGRDLIETRDRWRLGWPTAGFAGIGSSSGGITWLAGRAAGCRCGCTVSSTA